MRALPLAILTLLLALTALVATVSAQQLNAPPLPAYVIIVHANNPITTADRKFLQDAFLRKTLRWPDDEVIRPVDLIATSSVRKSFSNEVLGRSISAVKAYWQQRIFSGRDTPPPEFNRDEKIVAYVLKHEGAVGYVSGAANLAGLKILNVRK
jgi:ABC-type phosphate transport system substrate-binding protein